MYFLVKSVFMAFFGLDASVDSDISTEFVYCFSGPVAVGA